TEEQRGELLADAERHYRAFEQGGDRLTAGQWIVRSKYSWAKLHCCAGRPAEARQFAEEAERRLRAEEFQPTQLLGRLYSWLARIHHELNNVGECRRYLQEAKQLLRRSGSVWHLARVLARE